MLALILLILIVALLFGAFGYDGGTYRGPGLSIVSVLIVILLVLFLTGRL